MREDHQPNESFDFFDEFMTEFSCFQQHFEYFSLQGRSTHKERETKFFDDFKPFLSQVSFQSKTQSATSKQILFLLSLIISHFCQLEGKIDKIDVSCHKLEASRHTLELSNQNLRNEIIHKNETIKNLISDQQNLRHCLQESESKYKELQFQFSKQEFVLYAFGEGSPVENEVEDSQSLPQERECQECSSYLKTIDELELDRFELMNDVKELKTKNDALLSQNKLIYSKNEQINELVVDIDYLGRDLEGKNEEIKRLEDLCSLLTTQLSLSQENESFVESRQADLMKEIEILKDMVRKNGSPNKKMRDRSRDQKDFADGVFVDDVARGKAVSSTRKDLKGHREGLENLMGRVCSLNFSLQICREFVLQFPIENVSNLAGDFFRLIFRAFSSLGEYEKRIESINTSLYQIRGVRCKRVLQPIVESNDAFSCADSLGSGFSLEIPGDSSLLLFYKSVMKKLKERLERQGSMILSLQRDNKESHALSERLRNENNSLHIKVNRAELLNSYLRKKQEILAPLIADEMCTLPSSLYDHMQSRIRRLASDRLELQLKLLDCRQELHNIHQSNRKSFKISDPKNGKTKVRFKTVVIAVIAAHRLRRAKCLFT